MKKIILYSLLSFALFSACKKDSLQQIDGKNPEERVAESLKKYSDLLTDNTYGWKAFLYPKGGGGYAFYLNFNKANRVTMYADLDYEPAQKSYESSYRLKSIQAPTLSFDTYNYIHILADPDPNSFGGVPGWGVYSDFEFAFDQQVGDTIKLNGKLLDSKLILVKATQAEQQSYNSEGLYQSVFTIVDYVSRNKNLYVLLGDAVKIQTTLDLSNKIFSLTYEANGQVITSSTAFAFTLNGITLQQPLFYKGKKITDLIWDKDAKLFYTMVDGNKVIIQVSPTPILPLHLLIGVAYTTITVPNATTYPGWGADFVTRRAAAASAILAGPYRLRLDKMAFKFVSATNTLVVSVDIYQTTNRFVADFPYSYSKTPTGTYKFTANSVSGNAGLIVNEMAPLFKERIGADQFTLDYYINPNTGATLGQFKSVEHPTFTFTGALQ